MPSWAIPLVIQGAEALFSAVAAFLATYGTTGDVHLALAAAAGMAGGKMLPSQMLWKNGAPKP